MWFCHLKQTQAHHVSLFRNSHLDVKMARWELVIGFWFALPWTKRHPGLLQSAAFCVAVCTTPVSDTSCHRLQQALVPVALKEGEYSRNTSPSVITIIQDVFGMGWNLLLCWAFVKRSMWKIPSAPPGSPCFHTRNH